jgi:hypothetical protein
MGAAQGCQPSGSDPAFDRYLGALGATLSLNPPGSQRGRVMPPPPPASMQLGIPDNGLERFDILALRGCAVQRNIIRRDTHLGRKAKPSQQLLLALEYLRLAPPCIRRLRGRDEALAEQMRDAWLQQRAQLPALIFNATLGGAEFAAFWRAAPVQGGYPRVDARDTAAALAAIEALAQRWLRGDYSAQDREFELWLAAVAGGTGGAQWERLSRRADALAAADRMLMRHGARATRCSDNPRQPQPANLALQISADFRRDAQPRYARALQRYRELLRPVAALEAQLHATLPPPYQRWMEDRNRGLIEIVGAPQQHLQQIAQLPRGCATQ